MLLLLLATSGTARTQEPASEAAAETIAAAALEAYATMAAGDGSGAHRILRRLINSPELDLVSEKLKREVLLLYSRSTQAVDGAITSYGIVVDVTEMAAAQPEDWLLRMQLAERADEPEDAAASLTRVARTWPDELRFLSASSIGLVIEGVLDDPDAEESYAALMDALVEASPQMPLSEIALASHWYLYAGFLLDRGDLPAAIEAAQRIRFVPALIAMVVDRRFDELVAALPEHFRIEAAIDREIELRKEMRNAHPALLSVLLSESSALMRGNRLREAVALLDSTMRPPEHARSATTTGWIDETEYLPWYLDGRAALLWRLGGVTEALAQLQEAKTLPMWDGSVNVSQTINLADYYGRSGQAERALAAVDGLEYVSAYGEMQILHIRVLAAIASDDSADLEAALNIMRRNRTDSQRLYQQSLIVAGRLDAAAEVLIDRLGNERSRAAALLEIQTYVDDSGDVPLATLDALYLERKRELLARPDVLAAIESVGRIMSFPAWFTPFQVFDDA